MPDALSDLLKKTLVGDLAEEERLFTALVSMCYCAARSRARQRAPGSIRQEQIEDAAQDGLKRMVESVARWKDDPSVPNELIRKGTVDAYFRSIAFNEASSAYRGQAPELGERRFEPQTFAPGESLKVVIRLLDLANFRRVEIRETVPAEWEIEVGEEGPDYMVEECVRGDAREVVLGPLKPPFPSHVEYHVRPPRGVEPKAQFRGIVLADALKGAIRGPQTVHTDKQGRANPAVPRPQIFSLDEPLGEDGDSMARADLLVGVADPLKDLMSSEHLGIIRDALDSMPDQRKAQAFLMFHLQDYTLKQLGAYFDEPVTTIQNWVFRDVPKYLRKKIGNLLE